MERQKNIVAFLGPRASYSHQAAAQTFPEEQNILSPRPSIEAVFTAVRNGGPKKHLPQAVAAVKSSSPPTTATKDTIPDTGINIDDDEENVSIGVVPFENSTNGPVAFTLDLFADDAKRQHHNNSSNDNNHNNNNDSDGGSGCSRLTVCGEIYLPVKHCLVGHASSIGTASAAAPNGSLPPNHNYQHQQPLSTNDEAEVDAKGSEEGRRRKRRPYPDLSHIRTLYSHPQAWGQCKQFLSDLSKTSTSPSSSSSAAGAIAVERHDVSSTSRAAELVAADLSRTSAAISSRMAAEVNGLDVLVDQLEDDVGRNATRFLILRREDDELMIMSQQNKNEKEERRKKFKTLIAFTVAEHGAPGALADALAVFRAHGLTLTSINTRPSGEAAWHYIFFVEIVGRRGDGGPVDRALEDLDHLARWSRWLGSWEDGKG